MFTSVEFLFLYDIQKAGCLVKQGAMLGLLYEHVEFNFQCGSGLTVAEFY